MARYFQLGLSGNLSNPDIARRSNLLNIILGGIGVLTLIGIIVAFFTDLNNFNIVASGAATLLVILLIYLVNRYISLPIASWLFLITLTLIFSISDSAEEVINGRTLFLFTIPIFMASVLHRPSSSFVITAFIAILLNILALQSNQGFVYIPPLGLFAVSIITWLSSRSLEEALKEVRTINKELDQRVEERTLELQSTNKQLQDEVLERKKIEEVLIITRDQAQKASLFKSELLARVSHELRTPLGAILGYLEMLRAGIYGSVTSEQTVTINSIISINHDLTRLVNELLEQAQAESGQIQLKNGDFSPQKLFQSVYERLLILAQNKNLQFLLSLDEDLPRIIFGDEQRLQQILVNLIGNAVKFTESGTIELIAFNINEEVWGFCVKDTGSGIPANELKHIFNEFHQVDHTYTRQQGGFGLGLSIVHQLITMMNGTIQVNSQPNHGTEFIIHLPKSILVKD